MNEKRDNPSTTELLSSQKPCSPPAKRERVGRQRLGVDIEMLDMQVVARLLRFGGARRGEGRCRPVSGEGEEVGQ